MKNILLFAMLFGLALTASAQTEKGGGKFNLGIEGNTILGEEYSQYKSFGSTFTGSVKYEYPIVKDLFVTGGTGYTRLFYTKEFKDNSGVSGAGFIPLKAGLKYYFYKGLFAEAQAGEMFGVGKHRENAFTWSSSIGYTLKNGVEFGIRYESWTMKNSYVNDHHQHINQLGLRVGYRF